MPNLSLGGKITPFHQVIGTTFFIPDAISNQLSYWDEILRDMSHLSRDIWVISSIVTSKDGTPRPGTSHDRIGAIDLAPIKSWSDPLMSKGRSPLLFDRRLFTLGLIPVANKVKIAIYVEQDHLHIGFTNTPGVYFFRDFSKYAGDSELVKSSTYISDLEGNGCFQLHPNGSLSKVEVTSHSLPLYHTIHPHSLLLRDVGRI